jgi:hypothetical protein
MARWIPASGKLVQPTLKRENARRSLAQSKVLETGGSPQTRWQLKMRLEAEKGTP